MVDNPNPQPGEADDNPSGESNPQSQAVRHSHVSALVPEHVARGVFSTGAVVVEGANEFVIDFLLRMSRPQQVAARVVLPHAVVGRFILALGENLNNYRKTFGAPPSPQPLTSAAPSSEPSPSLDDTQVASADQSSAGAAQTSSAESAGVVESTPDDAQTSVPSDAPASAPSSQSTEAPTGGSQQPSPEELYEQLKMPDDVLSGNYANAVMIGHTAAEFCFDFITTFFPRSAVSCRVYLSAPNVPRLYDSLKHSFDQHQKKLAAARIARAKQQPPPDADPTAQ